jgi:actin related protein 2/3 complex subunit 3
LDETLTLFRANSFFRNFEIKSPADILLIYSTLFIQECLSLLSSKPILQGESSKLLLTHASRNFPIPGEPGFPLNAIVDPITSREDQGTPSNNFLDLLKTYLQQLRSELASRLLEKVYTPMPFEDPKLPSKWWMCFSKRKFMNLSGVGTLS